MIIEAAQRSSSTDRIAEPSGNAEDGKSRGIEPSIDE
jgi:hypothetical protein